MNKFLMGAAATTLLLSSCAQNDLLNGPSTPNDGKIRFSGTTGLVKTKAAPGNPYNSTADLQGKDGAWGSFFVKGYVDGSTTALIGESTAEEITFNGNSWEYKTPANEPYWPNATMNFYAFANWATSPTIESTGITASVTINDRDENYKQKDLLVAANISASKEIRTLLTFKHALTQIVFKAGNVNSDKIGVVIDKVEIHNVGEKATMTYTNPTEGVKWSDPTAKTFNYNVAGIQNYTVQKIEATDINTFSKYPRVQTDVEPNNNALMLIPQVFTAWDPNSGTTASASTGAYIKLNATIVDSSVVTESALGEAKNDDVKIKELMKYVYAGTITGGATTAILKPADVLIPVESADNQAGKWEAGKRINYILTFGDSNSGSGGGGYDNNGDPILVPIRFRAVVEDWVEVDVPILTASFEATSSTITHNFINGYTNQLLNDIKAAAAPKLYQSTITIKGTTSATIGTGADAGEANSETNVQFLNTLSGSADATYINAKFRPGSTLTYNLTGVTNLESNANKAKIVVPKGWKGMLGATPLNELDTATLDTEKKLVLTKVATTGYSYICQAGYIEDNLASIELNENYTATANVFTDTIYVKSTVPTPAGINTAYTFSFSADMLAKIVGASYEGAKAIIDLKAVTGWGIVGDASERNIATWCPTGWVATVEQSSGVTTTYFPGDAIVITNSTYTKNITFTKAASTLVHIYKQKTFLEEWLNTDKANDAVFYYDNVDFDVVFPATIFNTSATITPGARIYLKYPVSAASVTGWTYNTAGYFIKN